MKLDYLLKRSQERIDATYRAVSFMQTALESIGEKTTDETKLSEIITQVSLLSAEEYDLRPIVSQSLLGIEERQHPARSPKRAPADNR